MNKLFGFLLEGENVDGDFISVYVEYENAMDAEYARHLAEAEATETLKMEGGGHIDIFDEDGTFLVDIEV